MKTKDLLKTLVEIPSVSKDEKEISKFIYGYLNENGISAKRYDNNVYCSIGEGKPSILLNSHLDTVPVCPGWDSDPYRALERGGKIYGLGANDAKGSLCAMINTMIGLADTDTDLRGTVYFGASVEEECGNKGIVELLQKIPPVDAAIIGEPTGLDIATAMRGLVILKVTSKGKSAHASRPHHGENAIYRAASDILKIKSTCFKEEHPLLGSPTVSVTLINGGTKNNVIPGSCEFTIDIRTTPDFGNDALINNISGDLKSDVEVLSNRFYPKETCSEEGVVKVAKNAVQDADIIGFRGMCDYAFIDAPGIILGPGNSQQSHSPNEFIEIKQVEDACRMYQKIIKEFLK
ncbi:MAG: M20/M25/M40 family metallo-hydrolase [Thermoplasmatota archaeon]